ncbi:hypothetical protein YC2023_031423 [Brassica napus]
MELSHSPLTVAVKKLNQHSQRLNKYGPGGDKTHVTTALTFLILAAPEYVDTGYLMTNSDVYSFGVDLYEIITGRRTIERMKPLAEKILVKWVKLYHVNIKSNETNIQLLWSGELLNWLIIV